MKYLSVCSGIEAATVAWHHMGWNPIAFSEIEKFPSEVLSHHYPDVPNLGDMTKFKEWNLNESIGLLVGGTPCQSFSVAGLRKGLEDPRGNLALIYCGILDKFKPKWFLWENVPGVLSSGGGRDFGSFLGAVAQLGYGFAYRVLDAQYFGVAQRRRRVFVVGYLGDWRPAAKVLFESESLRRDTPPSRSEREKITARSGIGPEISGPLAARRFAETDGLSTTSAQMIAVHENNKVGTLMARDYKGVDTYDHTKMVAMVAEPIALAENTIGRQPHNGGNGDGFTVDGPMYTLNATGVHGVACIGGQHPNAATGEELSPTLTNAMGAGGGHIPIINDAVAYGFEPGIAKREGDPNRFVEEMTPTLRAGMGDNQTAVAFGWQNSAQQGMAIDQITPTLDTSKTPAVAVYESHAQDARYNEVKVCPTVSATYGMGGGNVPLTINNSKPFRETADCLTAAYGTKWNGNASATNGSLFVGESKQVVAPTLTTNDPSRSPQATEVTNQIAAVFEASSIISWDSELNPNVDKMGTLMRGGQGGRMDGVMHNMAVRRLTPMECERLQGFPDHYTDIKPKGKPTPDGPRYKALGNSMAVPVMKWIGERINQYEKGELK